jgi:hypothetical protein
MLKTLLTCVPPYLFSAAAIAVVPNATPETLYVHAGHVLADPANGRVLNHATVIVSSGKIVRIA